MIDSFILDFYCAKLKLAIELDGYTHRFDEVVENDKEKGAYLETVGIHVLRLKDEEVMTDISSVLHRLEAAISGHLARHTPVSPLTRGDHGHHHRGLHQPQ